MVPQQQQPPFPVAIPTLPVQGIVPHPSYVLPVSQASTRDSSPSNSDYSSPLPSPLLKKKVLTTKETDSSSEDNDRGKAVGCTVAVAIESWISESCYVKASKISIV